MPRGSRDNQDSLDPSQRRRSPSGQPRRDEYTDQTQRDSSRQYHRHGSPRAQRAAHTSVSSTDPADHDRLAGWSHAQHPAYSAQPPSMLPRLQSAMTRPPLPGMYQQPTQQQHLPPPAPQPMQHLPLPPPLGPPQSHGRPRPAPSAGPLPLPPRPPQSQGHPRPTPPARPLSPAPARTMASTSTAVQPNPSDDPALDFFSEHFDALKALQTRGLQPPVPKIKPLDNVTRCRMILPPELPDSAIAWSAAHPKAEPTHEAVRNKELAKQRTAAVLKREQDQAAKGNTLDKIAKKFTSGPLLLLRRYYRTSVRLQVATRHASGVRGVATGYLHGFDKFMNLVLMNVDEDYTVMVRVPHNYTVMVHAPAEPQPADQGGPLVLTEQEVHKFRWKRKAEKRNRRLHQVFLRGDNVVTIKPVLQDVQKQWPQLVLQWAAAGIPETVFSIPPQLATASQSQPVLLPPGPPQSAAVAHLTPSWAHVKR